MIKKKKEIKGLDMVATGKRINFLIKVSGFKTKEIADTLGISFQAVDKWRKGKNLPDAENMYILSQILNVKVDDILVPYTKNVENEADNRTASMIQRLKMYILAFKVKGFQL